MPCWTCVAARGRLRSPPRGAVGPSGNVLGLDLAQPLLALARQRAANLGLTNVSFRECDATVSGLHSGSFDAVVCVFGVFFAADMPAFAAEMWRLVRPGGTPCDHHLGT